ncbi:MAG: hypothetical protein WBB69_03950 [Anaerolineales bacterium]
MNLSTIDPVLDSRSASLAYSIYILYLITMGTKVENLPEISLFQFLFFFHSPILWVLIITADW